MAKILSFARKKNVLGFKIEYVNSLGWYIYTNTYGKRFLHKNGTLQENCGKENFWETEEEADEFLSNWYMTKGLITQNYVRKIPCQYI
jgi:hypothetical protein